MNPSKEPAGPVAQRFGRGRWVVSGMLAAAVVVLLWLAVEQVWVRNGRRISREVSQDHLKVIGLALMNYSDTYGRLPAVSTDDGAALSASSWFTMILPFLDQNPAASILDSGCHWNHLRNVPRLRMEIPVFQIPGASPRRDSNGFALAHYAPSHDLVVREGNRPTDELSNGQSHTVLAGEIGEAYLPWGQPGNERDPRAVPNNGPGSFGRWTGEGAFLLMADGSVRFVGNGPHVTSQYRERIARTVMPQGEAYHLETRPLRPKLDALVQVDSRGISVALWIPAPSKEWESDPTDDDLLQISEAPRNARLEHVSILARKLTSAGAAALQNLKRIQVLELSRTTQTADELEPLLALPALKTFILSDTSVTESTRARWQADHPEIEIIRRARW